MRAAHDSSGANTHSNKIAVKYKSSDIWLQLLSEYPSLPNTLATPAVTSLSTRHDIQKQQPMQPHIPHSH